MKKIIFFTIFLNIVYFIDAMEQIPSYAIDLTIRIQFPSIDHPEVPLCEAIKNKDDKAIKTIIQEGIKPNYYSMVYAIDKLVDNPNDYELIKFLLQYGANPHYSSQSFAMLQTWILGQLNIRTKQQVLALFEDEPKKGLFNAIKKRNIKVATRLLGQQVNPNIKDKAGRTPLMYAVLKRDSQMIKILLNYGADINQIDNKGNTALSCAQERGHKSLIPLLQKKERPQFLLELEKIFLKEYNEEKSK